MNVLKQHFLAVLICFTAIVCFAIHAVSHRYVHAGGRTVLDKWTGELMESHPQ